VRALAVWNERIGIDQWHLRKKSRSYKAWSAAARNSAKKLDVPRIDKEKEALLTGRVPDRSVRVQAPDAVVPTGRFLTLEQALAQFNAGRTRSIQFAEDRCDDLYCLASEHPRFGPVNGVELLIIIAGHSRRHAEQIRETRAALEEA
jgi:hypothetical protein